MYKDIVLCDGISEKDLESVTKFIEEWESHSDQINVFTSGSTGVPKQITLKKNKVKASALATGKFFQFKKEQTLLLNLSTDYIAGKLMVVRAIEHQMRIIIAPNQANPLLSVNSQVDSIDFGAFVPYQVEAILNDSITEGKYGKIKNVIIGGAQINKRLESKIRTLRNQSFATFGMTETITHFALRNISMKEEHYTCLPGFKIETDFENRLILLPNEITTQLTTNDVIDLKNEKQFIWKGRLDNVVNSAGLKISPELLEQKLEHLFLENRFYFKGRKSERFGEELILYIEGEKMKEWNIIEVEIKKILTGYEQPKEVIFVANFHETKTGKVLRINV